MKKILVVEDSAELAELLVKRLNHASYEVEVLTTGFGLVSRLMKKDNGSPDAVILDMMLPERSGFDLINSVKSIWPQTKLFVFSSFHEYQRRIPPGLADGFFLKTDGMENLISSLAENLT